MTTAIAVAAALAFTFALGSLIAQVDGATLRRWRLSRRWDVSRLAREFIKAADEPLATLHGLTHMINAWERGARRPSERYWLLYLRVFPECANGEAAKDDPKEAGALVGSGIVAAILNFGATVREGGLDVTQRQTAVAAGASVISSAVVFLLLYGVGRGLQEEAAKQRNIVLILGSLVLITVGALGSMAGSLWLTGYPVLNDYTASLAVYVALFGALWAVAQSEENERKSKTAKVESAAADTID